MNRIAALGVLLAAIARVAGAADSVPPVAQAPLTGFSTLFQVVVALGLVLAAIGMAAWLARRYLPGGGVTSGPVRVVGGVMVGTRERVVVIEIDGTWIVLGVTASHVQALHTLPRPPGSESLHAAPLRADELLSRWLSRRRTADVDPPG